MKGLLSVFAPANRTKLMLVASLLGTAIAVAGWRASLSEQYTSQP